MLFLCGNCLGQGMPVKLVLTTLCFFSLSVSLWQTNTHTKSPIISASLSVSLLLLSAVCDALTQVTLLTDRLLDAKKDVGEPGIQS